MRNPAPLTRPSGATRPQVEFDVLGNLLVTWGENGGVWARALDADGTPLGAPVAVGTEPVGDFVITPGLYTVRLTDGSFASAWTDGTHAFATKPTAAQAASRPALAAARDAFAGVASEIVGPGVSNLCSTAALVPVPLRGTTGAHRPGKLTLGGRAELYDHHVDTDTLKLTCLPATL